MCTKKVVPKEALVITSTLRKTKDPRLNQNSDPDCQGQSSLEDDNATGLFASQISRNMSATRISHQFDINECSG